MLFPFPFPLHVFSTARSPFLFTFHPFQCFHSIQQSTGTFVGDVVKYRHWNSDARHRLLWCPTEQLDVSLQNTVAFLHASQQVHRSANVNVWHDFTSIEC
eukprot:PhF_6_TR27896/c1_g4_i2/m.40889